jgi:hypothetical protein
VSGESNGTLTLRLRQRLAAGRMLGACLDFFESAEVEE